MKNYRRTYKYEAEAFLKKASAILETIPGIKKLSERKRTQLICAAINYELQTIYGRLEIHVYDDWIPTRFTEIVRRDELPSLIGPWPTNQVSGKWNFHYSFQKPHDLKQLDGWLEAVWREIEDITIKQ